MKWVTAPDMHCKDVTKGTQGTRRGCLKSQALWAGESTVQRDMQKEQGSAQSKGVNTQRKQNASTMQFLQNVNNKSEGSA